MKEIKKVLRHLENNGFRITSNDGSKRKIYPPDKDKPFYSFHASPAGLMPLIQFSKRQWNLDLSRL